jgi:hypothetical protein
LSTSSNEERSGCFAASRPCDKNGFGIWLEAPDASCAMREIASSELPAIETLIV